MRKLLLTICLTGSALLILDQFEFFDGLLAFFLAGVIPGTKYSIPSSIMYGLALTLISAVIVWFIGGTLFDSLLERLQNSKKSPQKNAAKKRLPKRRYGQV